MLMNWAESNSTAAYRSLWADFPGGGSTKRGIFLHLHRLYSSLATVAVTHLSECHSQCLSPGSWALGDCAHWLLWPHQHLSHSPLQPCGSRDCHTYWPTRKHNHGTSFLPAFPSHTHTDTKTIHKCGCQSVHLSPPLQEVQSERD